ncbi:MAG: phosphoglucosamine mutase, partial [Elusimicrobia bacterium]|nr:phosphoglucosamine mutase [Elusimicrobiota bacterium]
PGQYPLVSGFIQKVGFAAVRLLGSNGYRVPGTAPRVLIARDSRSSGISIAKALQQGIVSAGCEVLDLGVIPTPALAYLTPRRGALCGVMISASHNPPEFNGIKFFSAQGRKLEERQEHKIEQELSHPSSPFSSRGKLFPIKKDPHAGQEYLDFLRSTFPANLDLMELKLVIDCANGAASYLGPRLFQSLGARVVSIGCRPSGRNINLGCGALDLPAVRRAVVSCRAHCGVALDGDADRVIFVDARGHVLDGDVLIGLAAVHLKCRGVLRHNRVATTVMANVGLLQFLKENGIGVVQVPVGDRYVAEAMEREDLVLGGESSGHIIFRKFAPAGDGLLTALQILAILQEFKKPIRELRSGLRLYPQILRNVPVDRKIPLEDLTSFQRKLRSVEKSMRGRGRILVRYSGTEPVLRILVEGPSSSMVQQMCSELVNAFKADKAKRGAG